MFKLASSLQPPHQPPEVSLEARAAVQQHFPMQKLNSLLRACLVEERHDEVTKAQYVGLEAARDVRGEVEDPDELVEVPVGLDGFRQALVDVESVVIGEG